MAAPLLAGYTAGMRGPGSASAIPGLLAAFDDTKRRAAVMASKDERFGSDGRTVLHVRSGDEPDPERADSGLPRGGAAFGAGREETVVDTSAGSLAGRGGATVVSAISPVIGPRRSAAAQHDVVFGAFAALGYASTNPVLRAAAPFLLLLSDLRLFTVERDFPHLSRQLAQAMRDVDRKLADTGVPAEDARIARYVLCEMADDLVANLPGNDKEAWHADGMLARFFGVPTAGSGFFEALNKTLAAPERHLDLLELMHACLALGFEGQYRGRAAGSEALRRVRRDVYETLRYFRDRPDADISPAWQGLSAASAPSRQRIPAWAIAAAMPAVVVAVFFVLRALVTDRAELAASALLALVSVEPVEIRHAEFAPAIETRPAPVPPPPVVKVERVTQIERISHALAPEIAAGKLEVVTQGDFIVVRLDDPAMFGSGSAELKADFQQIADQIVATLKPEPGPIRVVGHTDSQRPGRTSVFKSNHDLSAARAQAVADVLAPKVGNPSRLEVEGKGDEAPVADNATAEGRARNRRVEIMIRKEETL